MEKRTTKKERMMNEHLFNIDNIIKKSKDGERLGNLRRAFTILHDLERLP
jgi:hypothetical protein